MLTSKQRAILRGKANTMDPVFIVGKGEIDETMIQGVKDCLEARELIKLKVLSSERTYKRKLLEMFLALGKNGVFRFEVVFGVHRTLFAGQGPDVPVGGEDLVVLAEEFFDGPRFGGGFYDNEVL